MAVTEKQVGKITASAILADVLESFQGEEDKRPANTKTVAEWAKEWGKGRDVVGRWLKAAQDAGKFKRELYRRKLDSGIVRPVPHYRYVGKKR